MKFSLKPTTLAINLALLSLGTVALPTIANDAKEIEVLTITHQRHNGLSHDQSFATGKTSAPDLANWLSSIPGANINSNGPVTGIAQYRGLFGDRVAATLDGHPIVGAGPNAMDTPLSYSTPLIVESMTVYRGIAPVSAGMDTLGGAIDVKMRKAETMGSDKIQSSGDIQAGYRSNNNANILSAVGNVAKGDVAVMAYGNVQTGDNMESGDGTEINPTEFDKVQLGGDIRYAQDHSDIGLSYHYTDTTDSGTPALPMDIEYIESHRVNLDGSFIAGEWHGEWLVGYFDAKHGMTNFLMREMADPSKHRRNTAMADTTDFSMSFNRHFDFGEFTWGVDGYFATHDSVVTNPNNAMFEMMNFNNVVDNRYGIFGQLQSQFDQTNVQLGVRVKRAEGDAGEVHMNMGMMGGMNSGMNGGMSSGMNMGMDLSEDFNNADREVSDTLVDIALSSQTQLSENWSLYAGVGLKNRAPSYQERYLWMPMEATAGLADGKTYIGDINLKAETAYQTDLGLTFQNETAMFSPHVFFQRIDNYIQGTPVPMNDMGSMGGMSGGMGSMSDDMMMEDYLKFSNVDAKLYGIDLSWNYRLSEQFLLSGIASYVKGERRDIDDNLYRIAPLNSQMSISYINDKLITNLTFVAVAAQDDVSATNEEQTTSGYGLVNIDVEYFVNSALTIRGGVDNLFNREYQNHLGGYNRVSNSETPVMTRLPSEGLSAWAEVSYSF